MDQQDTRATEAFIAGRRVGKQSLSADLNPHQPGSAEFIEWREGHLEGVCDLADYANQKARADWWANDSRYDSTFYAARGAV